MGEILLSDSKITQHERAYWEYDFETPNNLFISGVSGVFASRDIDSDRPLGSYGFDMEFFRPVCLSRVGIERWVESFATPNWNCLK